MGGRPELSHILPLPSQWWRQYQIILIYCFSLFGDRGTCVWTTCPRSSLPGSALGGSRTCNLRVTSSRCYHYTTKLLEKPSLTYNFYRVGKNKCTYCVVGYIIITLLRTVRRVRQWKYFNKKFEPMLTRRAKAYSSSGSVVTHRSTNWAWRRVTSFQSKRVTNYAMPPTPVSWRHLVNDIDLRSPKSLKPRFLRPTVYNCTKNSSIQSISEIN